MPIKTLEEYVEEVKKKDFKLQDENRLTKFLVVSYDIVGKAYSRNKFIKDANGVVSNKSDYDRAVDRLKKKYDDLRKKGLLPRGETWEDHFDELNNWKRNSFRDKLLRMGAVYQTASTYLLPIRVIRHKKLDHELTELSEAEEFIRAWGQDLNVQIFTYGMELTTPRSIETLSKAYVQQLKDQLEEMDTFLEGAYDDFKKVADDCEADPKTNTRGFHRKIEVIDYKVQQVQDLINRYGNKHHQFELTKITSTAKDISRAYGRMRDAKGRPISNE